MHKSTNQKIVPWTLLGKNNRLKSGSASLL